MFICKSSHGPLNSVMRDKKYVLLLFPMDEFILPLKNVTICALLIVNQTCPVVTKRLFSFYML